MLQITTVRRIYLSGILPFSGLIILAVIFYRERTVFIDVAFLLFDIIKGDSLAVQASRYGAAITQCVPLWASRMHIPLSTLALLYSAWVVVYYFICYLLSGLIFKNYRMALVLLLYITMFASDSFYWMQAELAQGIPFMLLVFAWLSRPAGKRETWAGYMLLLAGAVTIVFFHPLMFIPALFLCAFLWIKKEAGTWPVVFTAAITIAAVIVKNLYFQSEYDTRSMSNASGILRELPQFFALKSTRQFLHHCLEKYYWIPLLSIGVIIFYIAKQRFAELVLFTVTAAGFIVLINTSYKEGAEAFYIENLYLPLGVFIAAPVVYDLLPRLLAQKRQLALMLVSLVAFTGVIRIYAYHKPYTERLQWEEEFLSRHRKGKWIYDDAHVPNGKLMMTWATPYEFWLLSTMKYNESASIWIAEDAEAASTWGFKTADFVTVFEVTAYKHLDPPTYFKFKDTVSAYRVVK